MLSITSCSHFSLIAFWAVTDLRIGSHFHSFLLLIKLGIVHECLGFVVIINNYYKSSRIVIFIFCATGIIMQCFPFTFCFSVDYQTRHILLSSRVEGLFWNQSLIMVKKENIWSVFNQILSFCALCLLKGSKKRVQTFNASLYIFQCPVLCLLKRMKEEFKDLKGRRQNWSEN